MPDITNDNHKMNEQPAMRGPDPHGHAALLLVESVIHGLIARSIISVAEAVEMVETAAEVRAEIAADIGEAPDTMNKLLVLLDSMAASLRIDRE